MTRTKLRRKYESEIATLVEENKRLWTRNAELEARNRPALPGFIVTDDGRFAISDKPEVTV